MKDGTCRGTAEWWPFSELWLCRIQILFLLENYHAYPPNPYVSGYTEAPKTSMRIGAVAPFEAEAQIWAEVDFRLEQTGVQGKWLLADAQKGITLGELAYEPRQALHYISGWYRKQSSFAQWKYDQERRRKPIIFGKK